VIRHRSSGISDASKTPYPGLSEAGNITLEGIYLADLSDLKALQNWDDQCKGRAAILSLGGYRREVTIKHLARASEEQVDYLSLNQELPVTRQEVYRNCMVVAMNLGDLDGQSSNMATWTLEIAFEEMEVL
jgi:hypothetical protein